MACGVQEKWQNQSYLIPRGFCTWGLGVLHLPLIEVGILLPSYLREEIELTNLGGCRLGQCLFCLVF